MRRFLPLASIARVIASGDDAQGRYLLRTNLTTADPKVLWEYYLQLTTIGAAFKNLKDDLQIRPIFHQKEDRIEAHIFVAYLERLDQGVNVTDSSAQLGPTPSQINPLHYSKRRNAAHYGGAGTICLSDNGPPAPI